MCLISNRNLREGTNALDAAFIAYSSISMLRQQMKPDHRVHGVVEGKNWAANGVCSFEIRNDIVRRFVLHSYS